MRIRNPNWSDDNKSIISGGNWLLTIFDDNITDHWQSQTHVIQSQAHEIQSQAHEIQSQTYKIQSQMYTNLAVFYIEESPMPKLYTNQSLQASLLTPMNLFRMGLFLRFHWWRNKDEWDDWFVTAVVGQVPWLVNVEILKRLWCNSQTSEVKRKNVRSFFSTRQTHADGIKIKKILKKPDIFMTVQLVATGTATVQNT